MKVIANIVRICHRCGYQTPHKIVKFKGKLYIICKRCKKGGTDSGK